MVQFFQLFKGSWGLSLLSHSGARREGSLARSKMECSLTELKIQPGDCIQVKGKILPDAKGFGIHRFDSSWTRGGHLKNAVKSFVVNLGKDCNNLVLHFNPRFDHEGDVNTIVCNSKQDGTWGEEERETTFPFQQGEKFQVSFTFDTSELKVNLAEGHDISFPNRLGLERVEYLSVAGDFKMKVLKFP